MIKPDHLNNVIPVRVAAIHLFDQIAFHAVTLDRAFGEDPVFLNLNPLDRALVRMIVTTTIRRLGQIDDIIDIAMNEKKPEPQLLQTLLRLSVAQIIFMNIPDHAAVNIAVDLTVTLKMQRQKGLVNAVLRRIAREGKPYTTKQDIPRLNTPNWMLEDWQKNFGRRVGLEIGQANVAEAPLDLSLKNPNDAVEIATALNAIQLPTGTLRVQNPSGSVENLPGFHTGLWWVQDAAAALPVQIMGDIKGKTVIDLCAAPGGKTAQLIARGAHTIAVDRATARLDLLRDNLKRLNMEKSITLIEGDGTQWQPDHLVDIVLIDAPCTATGTLRRNPDIILHRTPDDVLRMTAVQARLLQNATKMIKPGGMIIYAVCSLQHAEGEGQIESFLKRQPGFTIDPLTSTDVSNLTELINPKGCLRALPTHLGQKGGLDGFFAARLIKNPE